MSERYDSPGFPSEAWFARRHPACKYALFGSVVLALTLACIYSLSRPTQDSLEQAMRKAMAERVRVQRCLDGVVSAEAFSENATLQPHGPAQVGVVTFLVLARTTSGRQLLTQVRLRFEHDGLGWTLIDEAELTNDAAADDAPRLPLTP
jgi:hypothetical protein